MARYATLVFAGLIMTIFAPSQNRSDLAPNGFAQSSVPATATNTSLNVPADTAFLAKLSTNLVLRQCKTGDSVEAEARQDIKQGHDVLLKKGSTLLGHITTVQLPPSDKPQVVVEIIFDTVRMKDGKQFSLNLIIQALAPEADLDSSSSLADHTGTGMASATRTAGVGGHSSTVRGSVNQLTPESNGIYDMQGVRLGDHMTNGTHYSVLASSMPDFQLKKGTQLVLRVLNQ
jgi:hypothetical protein